MRVSLCLIAALLWTPLAYSQTREDTDAASSLALHVAAARHAAVSAAQPKRSVTSYADAVALAHLTHKPVLVSVGIDCSTLCSCIRADIPAVHAIDFAGDASPGLWLIEVGADGKLHASARRTTLPTEAEVRAAAHRLDKLANPLKPEPKALVPNLGSCPCNDGQCDCLPASTCPGGCPVAPQPQQPFAPQYVIPQYQGGCPGGNCPNVQSGTFRGGLFGRWR